MYLKKISYRPEIDGLRAIAVLPVILFHAGFSLFNGGFVGVDVFFVISGYLITSIILKDLDQKKFTLKNFYTRRIKRILPALIVIITFSFFFSIFLLPPEELKSFSKSVISALTFWSNFLFSFETDYFDIIAEYKPLLHTWSLSIEEQFYILYPLFFILLFKINRKLLLLCIIFISLSSLFITQLDMDSFNSHKIFNKNSLSFATSFMMPFGRIWELGLGGLCSYFLYYHSNLLNCIKNKNLLELFSFLGLFLIFLSIFILDRNFPYPSFYTLMPCVGTALIIIFCQKNILIYNLLSLKFLVFIGLISYSAYLIHFPFFTFLNFSLYDFNTLHYIFFIFSIFVLAFINWKFIEVPARSNITTKKLLTIIIFIYFILLISAYYIFNKNGLENRAAFKLPKHIEKSFDRSKKGDDCFDIKYIHEKKNNKNYCIIGKKNKKEIDFIVLGDSHIISFYPLLNELSLNNNKKGLFVGYSGCIPFMGVYPNRTDQKELNCNELNNSVFNLVNELNIKNLILLSRWTYYTEKDILGTNFQPIGLSPNTNPSMLDSKNAFKYGLNYTLNEYNKKNIKVFIVEQAPHQTTNPKLFYYHALKYKNEVKLLDKLKSHSISLNQHNELQKFVSLNFKEAKNKYKNLYIVSFDNVLCSNKEKKCVFGNKNTSYYLDRDHLSTNGVKLLKNIFKENFLFLK